MVLANDDQHMEIYMFDMYTPEDARGFSIFGPVSSSSSFVLSAAAAKRLFSLDDIDDDEGARR